MGAKHTSANATVSAHGALSITASNSTVLPVTRALYIGTSGDVAVRMTSGTVITFTSVPVGILPVQVDQVLSTGTTASDIIALY